MPSENQKVLATIVTFNGAETIRETLTALKEQNRTPDAFLIIDNASKDETVEIIRELKISNLEINQRNKNEGVAAAYNIALKYAIEKNFDWLLLFDQDSACQTDCLEILLAEAETIKTSGIQPSVLFPTHYLKSHPGQLLPPEKWDGKMMHNVTTPDSPEKNYTLVHTSMTSGALYNIALIKSEKGFREDFFIDFVDHEYHIRLTMKGHKIFWISNAHLSHSLGKTGINQKGQVLIYHEPWRYYFIGRNMFYCHMKWGGFPAIYHLWKSVKEQYETLKIIEELNHKAARKYFKRGIRDSFFQGFCKPKPPKQVIQSIR